MNDARERLPNRVWFLWFEGIDKAPPVVKECYRSWIDRNPTWDVTLLTRQNVADATGIDPEVAFRRGLSPAHVSDLVRTELLSHHGGIWTDATCFCARSLDLWLPDCMGSGFFAFARPGRDRVISSWFLASERGNAVPTLLHRELDEYWSHTSDTEKRVIRFALEKVLQWSPRTADLWFSPVIEDRLKISPYYAFHYKFHDLVRSNPECRLIW
jgi:hypothetical protein